MCSSDLPKGEDDRDDMDSGDEEGGPFEPADIKPNPAEDQTSPAVKVESEHSQQPSSQPQTKTEEQQPADIQQQQQPPAAPQPTALPHMGVPHLTHEQQQIYVPHLGHHGMNNFTHPFSINSLMSQSEAAKQLGDMKNMYAPEMQYQYPAIQADGKDINGMVPNIASQADYYRTAVGQYIPHSTSVSAL